MENLRNIDYHFFRAETLPSEKRNRRIIKYLPPILKAMMLLTAGWVFCVVRLKCWYMIGANVFLISSLLFVNGCLAEKRTKTAMHALMISTLIYIALTCLFMSGTGDGNGGAAHYWSLPLIVGVYFVFIGEFKARVLYTICGTAVFLIFEYGLIPFEPVYILPREIMVRTHIATILCVIATITFFLHLLVKDYNSAEKGLMNSNDRMENLLNKILPEKIADRLKNDGQTFAEGFVECSVLFADLVGFTAWADGKRPEVVVEMLNRLFSEFDDLCDRYKIEKIKTIGDAYMVATGVPDNDPDHACNIVKFALKIREMVETEGLFKLRIGINSGVVVAGIIGKKKFLYDLWGDSVNIASRLESSGRAGAVQISQATHDLIAHHPEFRFTASRSVRIKGKGELQTYYVESRESANGMLKN